MKTIFASVAVGVILASAPASACTPAQKASLNTAIRAMHMAVDISKTVGGPDADDAVHALLDLVDSIDAALPASCGN